MDVKIFANGQWVTVPHDGRLVIEIDGTEQKFTISEKESKLNVYSNHCRPTIEVDGNNVIVEDRYVGKS